MALTTALFIHDLTSPTLYCAQFNVECYSDSGLTTLVASGTSPVKWDGSVWTQTTGIFLEGLTPGGTYYLRWGAVTPQTGAIGWSSTQTVTAGSSSAPSVTFSAAYYPVSSGITYIVTPSSPSSDVDHYEAFWNFTGTTPSSSQVANARLVGATLTTPFHFFVGQTPGTTVYAWVRAVNTGLVGSTWFALTNQTVVNFVGNLDNISDGTTYAKTKASALNAGDIASVQGVPVTATAPTTGQVLTFNGTAYAPATPSSGMTNPMTTAGDTIYEDATPTPVRLSIGSTGQVLTVAAGLPVWATPSGGGGGGANFASNETLTGGSSPWLTWTLAHTPSPTASLQLFLFANNGFAIQIWTLLVQVSGTPGTGQYSLSGTTVTLHDNPGFGAPVAWYTY